MSASKTLKVLIGGGSGFIGRNVRTTLEKRGHTVHIISRTAGKNTYTWDDIKQKGALPEQYDVCIQLSGANIMEKKWTPERKQELIESRAGLTRIFVDAISNTKIPPKAFVSGSAVGIYPTDSDKTFDETYQGPWNPAYSGQLVSEWENASKSLEQKNPSIRRAVVRTGVVLSRSDGALPQLVLPFGLAVSGRIGAGNFWFPWIHLEDITNMFVFAAEQEKVTGVLNGVAPGSTTQAEFSAALAHATGRLAIPVPAFALKLAFGERSELLLEGSKILPNRATELGFQFNHPELKQALYHIFAQHQWSSFRSH